MNQRATVAAITASHMKASTPGELNFESGASAGWQSWVEGRERSRAELTRELGLPVGRRVEVWLRDGLRLTGRLQLREELLFLPENKRGLELMVDGVTFRPNEIESCVAMESP